ncbi:MAG: AAA family ATPase [Desulfococcaceae bacterium]
MEIKGFKSIDSEGQTIEFQPITVMLGANGAGKSNLVSFFKLLNAMMSGGLQRHVADQGFADALLYFGGKNTPEIQARLQFQSTRSENEYEFVLERNAAGNLFFRDEKIQHKAKEMKAPRGRQFGSGSRESQLKTIADAGDSYGRIAYSMVSGCRVFQFHDTSATAGIRGQVYKDDAKILRGDGGNLAAFLRGMRLRSQGRRYYDRIVRHVRQVIPQFEDFDLEPLSENEKYVRLNWRERGSDFLFGPHQLSDGSLRFVALAALFMQPPDSRPKIIVVDEPELGLHPAALSELAGMVKAAASVSQVILATQSCRLIDEFSAGQVLIVERRQDPPGSVFRRLEDDALAEWLARYSLSELWEKNVFGGRP